MGARYLLELANVLRAAGISVNEGDGKWHFRARATGGYEAGRPTHVMWHHTASPASWDGQKDYEYIAWGKEFAPIANLYIDRQGVVWVCAGGATNTNGVGKDTWGGGVPENRMNEYAIGVEIGNNGVGEAYSAAQRMAVLKTGVVLGKNFNIPVGHQRAHFEWRPNGKIDPAGPPSPWARPGDQYQRWDMDQFRGDIWLAGLPPTPPVTPPTQPTSGADMKYIRPARGFDSRQPPIKAKLKAGTHYAYLKNFPGVPENSEAVTVVVTATEPSTDGYMTLWDGVGSVPLASDLNFSTGQTIANTTVTPVKDGRFAIFLSTDSHLVLDVKGYQPTKP